MEIRGFRSCVFATRPDLPSVRARHGPRSACTPRSCGRERPHLPSGRAVWAHPRSWAATAPKGTRRRVARSLWGASKPRFHADFRALESGSPFDTHVRTLYPPADVQHPSTLGRACTRALSTPVARAPSARCRSGSSREIPYSRSSGCGARPDRTSRSAHARLAVCLHPKVARTRSVNQRHRSRPGERLQICGPLHLPRSFPRR